MPCSKFKGSVCSEKNSEGESTTTGAATGSISGKECCELGLPIFSLILGRRRTSSLHFDKTMDNELLRLNFIAFTLTCHIMVICQQEHNSSLS